MVVGPYVSSHYQLCSQLSAVCHSNRCGEKTITSNEVNTSRPPFSNCWCRHYGAAINYQWKQVCNCFPRSVYQMANGLRCTRSESNKISYFISEGDNTHVWCTRSFTIRSQYQPTFVSNEDVCKLLGIKKFNTTAHHPQCNDMVERFNRTLKTMLRKHVSRFVRQWDTYLSGVLWAHRNMPHSSTGEKPSFLLFGFHCHHPTEAATLTNKVTQCNRDN